MKWMQVLMRWMMASLFMVASLGAQAASPTGEYVLGPGDQIRVSVFQSPDMLLETRLNAAGAISYPLIGSVQLGGLTVSQAEQKIATALRDGNFLKQPQVSILVLAVKSNQVSVLGYVNRPGRYPLEAGTSKVSEALAQAGGILPGSGSELIVVAGTRDGKPFRKEIDFPLIFSAAGGANDIALQNGDAIFVDRAPQIYIYGEVQRPGAQVLLRDTTLLQALATGGGLTLRGTERGIRVHRRDASGQVKVIQPDMNDKLLPGDVVYVRESLF
jgi:polysaccharide export outer membrane protein